MCYTMVSIVLFFFWPRENTLVVVVLLRTLTTNIHVHVHVPLWNIERAKAIESACNAFITCTIDGFIGVDGAEIVPGKFIPVAGFHAPRKSNFSHPSRSAFLTRSLLRDSHNISPPFAKGTWEMLFLKLDRLKRVAHRETIIRAYV